MFKKNQTQNPPPQLICPACGEGFITGFDSFPQNAKKTWFLKQAPQRPFTLNKSKISLGSTKKRSFEINFFQKHGVCDAPERRVSKI